MPISNQLSMQQIHETVSFYHSTHRLILVLLHGGYFVFFLVMSCICFILDCDVAHILYTVKTKRFNVLLSS